jgi:hypothetical protein
VQYSTGKLPDAKLLWSPRLGFNWDVRGDQRTQVRGGTGVFTGRPAYVWISNQIGNTGVLTGFEASSNTRLRPFHPDPNRYKPANVTGDARIELRTGPHRSGLQVPPALADELRRRPAPAVGLDRHGRVPLQPDVNGVYYINANLAPANTAFSGPDNRPRWTTGNRINGNVANAVVLKNQNEGRSWNLSGTLEKTIRAGFFVKVAYSYGEAKNTVDPGSIAFGSWNNNQHQGDPNNPGLAFSGASAGPPLLPGRHLHQGTSASARRRSRSSGRAEPSATPATCSPATSTVMAARATT